MATESRYLHGHHESVMRSHAWRTVDNSAAYLAPHLHAGLSLLDVGSGPGTITIDFATRLAPGRVVGIDAGADVVQRARRSAEEAGVAVEFAVGDLYALDFADDTFDIVHAHQVMQYMTEPLAALAELKRVLKPGGLLALRDVDYGGIRWAPPSPGLERWLALYEQVARANGGEPDAGPLLTGWAQQAGFRDVVTSASIWCFASDADREWWGGLWADRALKSEFTGAAIERGLATQGDLEVIAAAWLAWAAEPAGVLNMPHTEVLARK